MSTPVARARRVRNEQGFTLIEALVGLALLAVGVVMITASIRSARLAMATVDKLGDQSAVPLAEDYLRSLLVQTQSFAQNNALDQGFFIGKSSELSFITSYSLEPQVKGLYQVTVGAVQSKTFPGAFDVVIKHTLFRPPRIGVSPGTATTSEATLISGIAKLSFAYFGEMENKPGSSWSDSWPDPDSLPSLVAIRVAFPKGDDRIWPTLTVPLYSSQLPM